MKIKLSLFLVLLVAFAAGAGEASSPSKLYHGAAYYPELWPESDVDRDIAEMKKLGINVVRMGEFAWATMEPDQGRISLEFFRRVMDKLHVAGIDVVMCTPTATPPVWLTDGHPERAFVNANGDVMIHGARQHVTYENADVRQACMKIVAAEAKALGKHPALVAWQIDNEFKCHVGEDFSDAAVAGWHKWLKAKYGTIGKLNAAWGTDIWSQRYQNFAQVPAPKKTPFIHNASLSTAYRLFNREAIAEFMDEQSALIRRHSTAPITHNMAAGFSINLERMSRNLDFVSFDDYPSSSEWANWIFDLDLFRSAKPGKPFWVMETSSSHNGWLGNNNETVHPPGFLVAEAVAAYASGGEAFNYWLWRQQRTGCELPHSAIMSAWFAPGIGHDSVSQVEIARRRLEPLLLASKPVPAEVAITWSDRGRAMLQTEALGAGNGNSVNYNSIEATWHRLLLDAGINREFRFEGASLNGLKLLITPAMPAVDDAFATKIEAWVRAGGIWICGPLTGTRTSEHTVPTDAGMGLVEALAGVKTVFGFPLNGTDAKGEALGVSTPLNGWCMALQPANSETKVVGVLKSNRLGQDLAFITERKLGKGLIVVLSAQPAGESGRKFLAELAVNYAKQAGVNAEPFHQPGTVVFPRAGADGKKFWIVVKMDGRGEKIDVPANAFDVTMKAKLPEGTLQLKAYEWRAVGF